MKMKSSQAKYPSFIYLPDKMKSNMSELGNILKTKNKTFCTINYTD